MFHLKDFIFLPPPFSKENNVPYLSQVNIANSPQESFNNTINHTKIKFRNSLYGAQCQNNYKQINARQIMFSNKRLLNTMKKQCGTTCLESSVYNNKITCFKCLPFLLNQEHWWCTKRKVKCLKYIYISTLSICMK